MKVAVVYATFGRAELVARGVERLERQSCPPESVVVSAVSDEDVVGVLRSERVSVVLGHAGLTAQRNAGLSALEEGCDIVVFFDDDFVPSRFWIESVKAVFAAYADVGVATGAVLKDGIKTAGIAWDAGAAIVDEADSAKSDAPVAGAATIATRTPYGCNMAYRCAAIAGLTFDERLVLYGWQEDRDFGARVVARGWRAIKTDAFWGVHLGAKRGRVSGRKLGYSQIVNPWYLTRKGTMNPPYAAALMARNFAANAFGAVAPERYVDRAGRLSGNLIAIGDVLRGAWRPERAKDL